MERRNFIQGLVVAPLAAAAAKFGFGKTVTPTVATEGIGTAASSFGMSLAEQQLSMLGQLLKTPAGRRMLARSLGPSLRRRRDLTSLCRKAFRVQDTHVVRSLNHLDLYVIDNEGGEIIKSDNPRNGCARRVELPSFNIASNPMIPIKVVQQGQFSLVARSLNLTKAEIVACEDAYMFAMIDSATDHANQGANGNPDITFDADMKFFDQVNERFEQKGVKNIEHMFVNSKDYAKMRHNETFKVAFAPERDRKKLMLGLRGCYNGCGTHSIDVHQSRKVSPGYLYITGNTPATEQGREDLGQTLFDNGVYAGYLADTVPLGVHSTDRPDLEQIGFRIDEEISVALNPIAVQRVKI